MGAFGSDGYLYDFAKRSAKDYMGSFGSDGYLYDFAKVIFMIYAHLMKLNFKEISRKIHGSVWI